MKQAVLAFIILAVPIVWLLYRPKLSIFKARLGRGIQVAMVAYFLILAIRLSTAPVDEEQLLLAGASAVLFVGVWIAAWLVTRAIEKTR